MQIAEYLPNPKLKRQLRIINSRFFNQTTLLSLLLVQSIVLALFIGINKKVVVGYNEFLLVSLNVALLYLIALINRGAITLVAPVLLRQKDKSEVYILQAKGIQHIPDPPTFDLCGYSWDSIIEKTDKEMDIYTLLPAMTSISKMEILKYRANHYGLVNDKLKYIPNLYILKIIRDSGNQNEPREINETQLNAYEKESPFVRVI